MMLKQCAKLGSISSWDIQFINCIFISTSKFKAHMWAQKAHMWQLRTHQVIIIKNVLLSYCKNKNLSAIWSKISPELYFVQSPPSSQLGLYSKCSSQVLLILTPHTQWCTCRLIVSKLQIIFKVYSYLILYGSIFF